MRIVLEHTTGPKAGIHEIIGLLADVNPEHPEMAVGDLPSYSDKLQASLVAVKRSYVLYRGIIQPQIPVKTFNPAQR